MHGEGAQQPARIDGDDHDEQRDGEQQLHSFEHLDNPVRGAAVQVVDLDHDPVDPGQLVTDHIHVRFRGWLIGRAASSWAICSKSSRIWVISPSWARYGLSLRPRRSTSAVN